MFKQLSVQKLLYPNTDGGKMLPQDQEQPLDNHNLPVHL